MIRATTLALFLACAASFASAQQGSMTTAGQSAGICQAAVNAGCACFEPTVTFQPRGAQLTLLSSDVLVSRNAAAPQDAAGFSPGLLVGDRVITGETGSAVVAFPNGCQINLQNQSLVTITQVEECACAAPVQAGGEFGAQGNGGNGNGPLTFAGITGLVIGGGAVIQSLSGSNGSSCVSPPCQ